MYRHTAIAAAFIFPLSGFAQDQIQVGRYLSIPAEATPAQKQPMTAQVDLRFPNRAKTVGDAMAFALKGSGYQLAPASMTDPAMNVMLTRPLPRVQKKIGPCPLNHALTVLAGDVFSPVVDPLHRLVSFTVKPQYRGLTQSLTSKPMPFGSMKSPVTKRPVKIVATNRGVKVHAQGQAWGSR